MDITEMNKVYLKSKEIQARIKAVYDEQDRLEKAGRATAYTNYLYHADMYGLMNEAKGVLEKTLAIEGVYKAQEREYLLSTYRGAVEMHGEAIKLLSSEIRVH